MHPLLHSVLTATTLLEFMLFATWFMYALHWIPGIASALYRNACFGGGPGTSTSFSLFRLHAPLLCHFNHRHFIHALWSTYVLYMYVAPLYHDMGGADFHRFVAALWLTLAAWKWAVDTLLSPSAPIHGLQYVGFACAVADLLLRRPSFLAEGAVSMFVGHAAFDMWKDLLRMVLQQTFFAQFLVGAVDWRMYLGAIVSPMVYLVVRSA